MVRTFLENAIFSHHFMIKEQSKSILICNYTYFTNIIFDKFRQLAEMYIFNYLAHLIYYTIAQCSGWSVVKVYINDQS